MPAFDLPYMERVLRFVMLITFIVAVLPIFILITPIHLLNPLWRAMGITSIYWPAQWLQSRVFSRGFLFYSGIRCLVSGEANVVNDPTIIISNHCSGFDPWTVIGYFPKVIALCVYRQNLEYICPPIFFLARFYGHVPIRRDDPTASRAKINDTVLEVADGKSLTIFPEGTRGTSDDIPSVDKVKKGAWHLAVDTAAVGAKVWTTPVAIHSAFEKFPRNAIIPHPGTIYFDILPQVAVSVPKGAGGPGIRSANDLDPEWAAAERDRVAVTTWGRIVESRKAHEKKIKSKERRPQEGKPSILLAIVSCPLLMWMIKQHVINFLWVLSSSYAVVRSVV